MPLEIIKVKKALFKTIKFSLFAFLSIGIITWLYFSSDRREVWNVYKKFESVKENCSDLYNLMSPEYRKNNAHEEFTDECGKYWVIGSPSLDMNWSKTQARIEPGLWNGGAVLKYIKIDDKWYLEGVIDWYYD